MGPRGRTVPAMCGRMRGVRARTLASLWLLAALAVWASGASSAPDPYAPPLFDELLEAMAGKPLLPDPPGMPFIDCPTRHGAGGGLPEELIEHTQSRRQWIFNGLYNWALLRYPSGTCVVVFGQLQPRLLRAAEARVLVSAAVMDLADPARPELQHAFNCHAKAEQVYGGDMPAYEAGRFKGGRYRIFYAALAPELAPLDVAQRQYAKDWKRGLRELPSAKGRAESDNVYEAELRFGPTGRSAQLATLEAVATRRLPDGTRDNRYMDWMVHVPSQRLIRFEDLFLDPEAVHTRIAAVYRSHSAERIESEMRDRVFMTEPASDNYVEVAQPDYEQARAYRESYRGAMDRLSRLRPKHFPAVTVGLTEAGYLQFGGSFSYESLPNGFRARWSMAGDELRPFMKPGYATVLERLHCPPLPPNPDFIESNACDRPDPHLNEYLPALERKTADYEYRVRYVPLKGPLAALDRLQTLDAWKRIDDFVADTAGPGTTPGSQKPLLSISYEAAELGDFASLIMSARTRTGAEPMRQDSTQFWILHAPTSKIVSFDGLFVDPAAFRQRLHDWVAPRLKQRLMGQRVGETPEAQDAEAVAIERDVSRIMDPATREGWIVSINPYSQCSPCLRFESQSHLRKHESYSLPLDFPMSIEQLKPWLAPEFRSGWECSSRTRDVAPRDSFANPQEQGE